MCKAVPTTLNKAGMSTEVPTILGKACGKGVACLKELTARLLLLLLLLLFLALCLLLALRLSLALCLFLAQCLALLVIMCKDNRLLAIRRFSRHILAKRLRLCSGTSIFSELPTALAIGLFTVRLVCARVLSVCILQAP